MVEEQGKLLPDWDLEPPVERFPGAFLTRPAKVPHLTHIRIEGLKGINNIEIELKPPLTVLTGPNNSGKSTILQGILLGFDIFRRCVDTSSWTVKTSGRAVQELDFLRVNEPKDLWFEQVWKPSKKGERYIRVSLNFGNDFKFVSRIRYLYGVLNVGIESPNPPLSRELTKAILSSAPILITASPGPLAHEPAVSLAQLHYALASGDSTRVIRNILLELQTQEDTDPWEFVKDAVNRHFAVKLDKIRFDEKFDLTIRSPYSETDCSLDIVSAGSGLNQILQLAAIIAWRKPGIVLLDEPDAHLHTTLQAKMLDFLYELSDRYNIQIILSTHSRDIISQAPLQAIVPVDLSRIRLQPMASLEHLLLEFGRQGIVSNVDLALLYQTKKCLFVEGPSDAKFIPKIFHQLEIPLFEGRNQIVTFEFEGIDNLQHIPQVASLFERMIGAKLSWAVVRDRDANLPEVCDLYRSQAEQQGTKLFIWGTYSLENLFLDSELLKESLSRKYPDKHLTAEHVNELLQEAVDIIGPNVGGVYITKAQNAYRALNTLLNKERPIDQGASDAYQFLNSLNTLEKKLKNYPGKKVFGHFIQLLQDKYGCTLRIEDVIQSLTRDNAPSDIMELGRMLSQLFQ